MTREDKPETPVLGPLAGRDRDLDAFAAQVAEACRQVPLADRGSLPARLARPDGVAGLVQALRGLFRSPRPEFGEAFRLLALNIRRLAAVAPLKSIVVMGAYPGDGRTTVAANLAIALTETGSRVVLVDADVRRPGLARLLRTEVVGRAPANGRVHPGTHGHDDRLAGPLVALATDIPGLALVQLPMALDTPLPATGIAPLLSALRSVADFVVVDTPPCQRHTDAFFLAPLAHGVLYVVRKRQQDVEEQRRIRKQLTQLGANLIGVVFNEGHS